MLSPFITLQCGVERCLTATWRKTTHDEITRDEDMRARDDTLEDGKTNLPELDEIDLPPVIAELHVDVIGLFHQLKAACDAQRAHVLVLTVEIKAEHAKRIELEARLREP